MIEIFQNLIDIETVLDALGIEYEESGDELYAICPNVAHDETKSSWSINRDNESESFGVHNCFGCGFRGNLTSLVADLLELDFEDAEDWIASLFGIEFDLSRASVQNRLCDVSIRKRVKKKNENQFVKSRRIFLTSFERIKFDDKYFKYLRGRGLTREQIRRHNVRKATAGKYRQRVVFPLSDPRGITVSFYARAISERARPKGLYPKGKLTISTVLFGWNYFNRQVDNAILTEGIFDALKVERILPRLAKHSVGNPLAVLGGNLSVIQSSFLKPLSEIFVLPDGDAGGEQFVERVERRLRHRVKLRVVATPRGCDPDEINSEELCDLILSARQIRRNIAVKINYKRV